MHRILPWKIKQMKLTNGNIMKQFEIAKKANAPLIAITTPDNASTIKAITTVYAASPIAQWDIINGVQSLTNSCADAVRVINTVPDGMGGQTVNAALATGNPVEMLMKINKLPRESIVCMMNAHMFVDKMQPGNLA